MNFLVTPFPGNDRIALFYPRAEDIWRSLREEMTDRSFKQQEIVAIFSTSAGHFPMVLHGEELMTIRDVCRKENWDCAGVFPRGQIAAEIQNCLQAWKQSRQHKIAF